MFSYLKRCIANLTQWFFTYKYGFQLVFFTLHVFDFLSWHNLHLNLSKKCLWEKRNSFAKLLEWILQNQNYLCALPDSAQARIKINEHSQTGKLISLS